MVRMKKQLEQWRPIFGEQRKIKVCLTNFKQEEQEHFYLERGFAEKARDFLKDPETNEEIIVVITFLMHIGQLFLIIGNYYLKHYKLDQEWRNQNELVVGRISDCLVDCYRKYCYFYHPSISEAIRMKLRELPSITTMLNIFNNPLQVTK